MGCLVDKFILRLKPQYATSTLPDVLTKIPNQYHPMMSTL